MKEVDLRSETETEKNCENVDVQEEECWDNMQTALIMLLVNCLTMLALYVLTNTWGLHMQPKSLVILFLCINTATFAIIKINNWFNRTFEL